MRKSRLKRMVIGPWKWQWLRFNPADHYESLKLELPGPWKPRAIRDLCRLVKEKKPKMVFLMETKLPSHRMESIRIRTGFDSVFVVDNVGQSGGLSLMWSSDTKVEIQNYSRRHVNAIVQTEANEIVWKLTGFYGNPEAYKRHEAWTLLWHLNSFLPEAWLCIGDFNEITDDKEKMGGVPKASWQMENFKDTLSQCQLHDLGYKGSRFTWCNMQLGGRGGGGSGARKIGQGTS
jgi:hypothetical protein